MTCALESEDPYSRFRTMGQTDGCSAMVQGEHHPMAFPLKLTNGTCHGMKQGIVPCGS